MSYRGDGRGRGGPRGGGGFRGGDRGGFRAIFKEGTPTAIDSRLRESDLNALIGAFRGLQLGSNAPERPLRPGFGTQGTPITLRANFFPYRLPKNLVVYEYRVEINPQTALKRRMFTLLEESPTCRPFINHIAHDGSEKLVSSRPLPRPLSVSIVFREEGESQPRPDAKTYTVSITLTATIDTNQLPSYLSGQDRNYNIAPLLSALNLVQQQHAARHGIRVGGSKYFFPLQSSQTFQLSPGVIAVQGFYVSVRPVYKELMANVNACTTAFLDLPGNMADALFAFNRNTHGAMPTLPPNLLKNIKVTTTYLGYRKRSKVHSIGTTSARNTFFKHDQYGKISVENYFKKAYPRFNLRYPAELPVINTGTAKKAVYIPAELCDIEPGQPYRGKLSSKETQQMIKVACNPPNVNAEAIVGDGFAKLGIAPPSTVLNNFGISVSPEMAVVPGRELQPPRLSYAQKSVSASNGAWNIMNVRFHRGAGIRSWWMMVVRDSSFSNTGSIVAGPGDPNLTRLRDNFAGKLRSCGVMLPNTIPRLCVTDLLPPLADDPDRKAALEIIRRTFLGELQKSGGQKPDFILVLLSHMDNFIYPGIKRIGDVELGLNTVHLQLDKATAEGNRQDQYLSNVALKINTKLGGVNHQLDDNAMNWLRKRRTMMVGIDVTHRGPGSKEGAPSIAAVVANIDDNFVQYPASLRIQQTHEIREMVLELKEMMVERLLAYQAKSGSLPERVFVFRDGVSEGQYDIVLSEELPQILEAFNRFNTRDRKTPYRPLLSVVICGKRHHARFYPTSSETADFKTKNTRPGTVVDKGVTGVFDFDFYLQAHAGLQGSVKSTHYIVIYDENRFTADEIQQGINNNSYLYAKATRAVSLIPPAYYADQACERGRYYLQDFLTGESDTASSMGRGALAREAEKQRVFEAAKRAWGQGIHTDMRNTMFYI
uniref:Putative argonaute-like protein n=1 Tax=Moniliophthora roreri TaxID=221103 RepID=A0A0W0FNM2_MONRR